MDEVKRIRTTNQKKYNASDEFETAYRREVLRKNDVLELYGLDLEPSSRRHRLSTAYVSLSIEDLENEDKQFSIEDCLNTNNCVIIRGDAGSGKTTLLKWSAINCASKLLSGNLEHLNARVPFLIRLREYANKKFPNPSDFIKALSEVLNDSKPRGWTQSILKNGKAILLIDGIDEVKESKREYVQEWIIDLINLYPNNKIIITSRPYALSEDWIKKLNSSVFDLKDMSLFDLQLFIDHWHNAVFETEQRKDEKEGILTLANELKTQIKENNDLLSLSKNPLMCAMLCALNRQRLTKLPSDKIELYKACISMFYRRDLERKIEIDNYEDIGIKSKNLILSDIAYWLIRNGRSETKSKFALSRIKKKIGSLQNFPSKTNAEGILKYFIERSGIVRNPSVGMIDFPHKTFQEYFAALSIVEESDYGILQNHLDDDRWYEVIILVCGIARKSEAETLIESILELGDNNSNSKEYLDLLAAYCSEMIINLSPNLKIKIQNRISSLFPPKSMNQAIRLSKIGKLILPFLTYEKYKKAKVDEVKRIVRTLAGLGNEGLKELSRFRMDKRMTIQKEIIESIKYCKDPSSYARIILKDITHINLGGNFPFDPILSISSLQYLTLDLYVMKHVNIEMLASLKNLRKLGIVFSKEILDINFIGKMQSQKELDFSYSSVRDYSNIGSIVGLRILKIGNLSLSHDFSFLRKLKNIKKILINSNIGFYRTSSDEIIRERILPYIDSNSTNVVHNGKIAFVEK